MRYNDGKKWVEEPGSTIPLNGPAKRQVIVKLTYEVALVVTVDVETGQVFSDVAAEPSNWNQPSRMDVEGIAPQPGAERAVKLRAVKNLALELALLNQPRAALRDSRRRSAKSGS